MTDTTRSAAGETGSIQLVAVPDGRSVVSGTCASAWQHDAGETGVIWVTANGGPDRAVSELDRVDGGLPASIDVIEVGSSVRSAVAEGSVHSTTIPFQPSELNVHALPDGDDLSALGSLLIERMEALESTDRTVVVCFDALDELLQGHDLQTVFTFLHVFAAKLRSSGATAHVAIDPERVDESTMATLEPIFDAVLP